jgi:hypothetical protein
MQFCAASCLLLPPAASLLHQAQEPDVWRQLAGKLQSMRQWQLNFDQKWEGYDA